MEWIDISMPLDEKVAVWPGDTPFTFSLNWTINQTGSVNVGKMVMSTHTGTHIDAPLHFQEDGKKVIQLDLERYIGRALVVNMEDKEFITVKDVEKIDALDVDKVLFKTKSWVDRSVFPSNIPYIQPGVAECLSRKGIKLLGVDLPSVDPLDSKQLLAHHELTSQDIHILEGLMLDQIKEGIYELIALPLPITEGDASPVRAIIRPL